MEHKRPEKQRVAEGPKKDDCVRSPHALSENASVVRARPTMGGAGKERNPKRGTEKATQEPCSPWETGTMCLNVRLHTVSQQPGLSSHTLPLLVQT